MAINGSKGTSIAPKETSIPLRPINILIASALPLDKSPIVNFPSEPPSFFPLPNILPKPSFILVRP